MANYDASIRVHTDIDTKRLKEAERDVQQLAKKLDAVRQRSIKLEALGGTEKQFESLGYDAMILEERLADATERVEQLRAEGFDKAEQSAKKCFRTVDKGAKKSNKSLGSTMKVLKNIVLSMVAFQVIAKGAEYIASGFRNLVQYSSELNGTFSELKSQTATLKNSMATAFAPIIAEIIPHLSNLVGWLNTAMNAMSQFWAVLGGKSTYTRAKKQVLDYAASIKEATKAAKGALATFDDLNVLNKKDSGNASGEMTGADAFEEIAVDESKFAWVKRLRDALNKISEAVAPILGKVRDGLDWLYENVFVPLGKWAMETALPAVIELIANVCEIWGEIIEEFQPVFEWLWNNFLQPLAEWSGDAIIGAIETLSSVLTSLWYDVLAPFIEWFKENVWPVIQPVIEEIAIAFQEMLERVSDIMEELRKILDGIIDFIAGVFTGNWQKAWDGLAQIVEGVWGVIKGIINIILCGIEALVNGVIAGINKIIDAINISIDVPEWARGAVGTDRITITNLPHVEKISLPRLATGGIVTASTLANIGEAGREAVLPLDNHTEWMDKLADRINSRGGETRVIVELDGKVVYNNVVKHDREHIKRTGSSSFAY